MEFWNEDKSTIVLWVAIIVIVVILCFISEDLYYLRNP